MDPVFRIACNLWSVKKNRVSEAKALQSNGNFLRLSNFFRFCSAANMRFEGNVSPDRPHRFSTLQCTAFLIVARFNLSKETDAREKEHNKCESFSLRLVSFRVSFSLSPDYIDSNTQNTSKPMSQKTYQLTILLVRTSGVWSYIIQEDQNFGWCKAPNLVSFSTLKFTPNTKNFWFCKILVCSPLPKFTKLHNVWACMFAFLSWQSRRSNY